MKSENVQDLGKRRSQAVRRAGSSSAAHLPSRKSAWNGSVEPDSRCWLHPSAHTEPHMLSDNLETASSRERARKLRRAVGRNPRAGRATGAQSHSGVCRRMQTLAFGFVATESEKPDSLKQVRLYVNPQKHAWPRPPLTSSRGPDSFADSGPSRNLAAGLLQVASPQLPNPTPELFIAAGATAADNAAHAGTQPPGVQDIIKRAVDQAAALRGEGE